MRVPADAAHAAHATHAGLGAHAGRRLAHARLQPHARPALRRPPPPHRRRHTRRPQLRPRRRHRWRDHGQSQCEYEEYDGHFNAIFLTDFQKRLFPDLVI